MGRYRSRSRSRSYSPVRRKRYDDPRDRRRDRRISPAPSGLLVRNISLSARPEDLRMPFERYGPIKDVYLPKNYYTGEPRGFGFVKFRYPEDAAEAKAQLNRSIIGGREIRIVFAEENRKTPQEMNRVSHVSSRSSYRRRSPSRSPRRRYRSYSRSPSPAGRDSRDGDRGARDDYYSPRRSRSVSRKEERSYRSKDRSPRRYRSVSRSPSPSNGKDDRLRRRRSSPGENGQRAHVENHVHAHAHAHDEDDVPSRSQSPRSKSQSPFRSHSRSYSPRR